MDLNWGVMKTRFKKIFLSESRAHWCSLMEGTDICFAPVLTLSEAPEHPHNRARNVFVNAFGVTQPAPSPRFSRTPGDIRRAPPAPGAHTEEVLKEWDVR
jgi:alpha-methylacyl-CoA racemase